MKKLIVTAVALMVTVAAQAQGTFLFNALGANNVQFLMPDGTPIGASQGDFNVQPWVSIGGAPMVALEPLVPLNRPDGHPFLGYPNPAGTTYTVPGAPQGTTVSVVIRAFQGTRFETSPIWGETSPASIQLVEPPTPPSTLPLGTQTITLIPEPTTWALGLLGLGAVMLFRRRK
jgi:hypothetical protein